MEIDASSRRAVIRRTILIVGLATIAAGLGAATAFAAGMAATAGPLQGKYLYYLALVCLALLGLVLLALTWLVLRTISGRFRPVHHEPTEYVDAWSLAGKRFKLDKSQADDQQPEDSGSQ